MKTKRTHDLPEYVSSSIGKPDLLSLANRVREMAAVLSAHGAEDAAAHLVQAYGTLLAALAARSTSRRMRKPA